MSQREKMKSSRAEISEDSDSEESTEKLPSNFSHNSSKNPTKLSKESGKPEKPVCVVKPFKTEVKPSIKEEQQDQQEQPETSSWLTENADLIAVGAVAVASVVAGYFAFRKKPKTEDDTKKK